MFTLITILHIFACVALIIIVLLQAGKGADIGASMGGAGGQTLFGTSSASTMLSKVTTGIAILFMLTSLFLAYSSGKAVESSVMDSVKTTTDKSAPAAIPGPGDMTDTADTKDVTTAPADNAEKADKTPAPKAEDKPAENKTE